MTINPATPRPFGPWDGPIFCIVYGMSGLGKTCDALFAFPRGLFLAMPGALKPARSVAGIEVDSYPVSTVVDATRIVHEVIQKCPNKYNAVVIDDLSLLAENTAQVLATKFKGFDMWGQVQQELITFKTVCRNAGFHVVCNAHETVSQTTKEGEFLKGGPTMPSKTLIKAIPHIADTVLRAGQDSMRKPWKGVYHCDDGNALWHEKDRHNAFRATSPMNLGEGFRDAGFPIPRAVGLEWQDEIAEVIAQDLVKGGDFKTLWERSMKILTDKGLNPLHVRWALRDGRDRFEFRKARQTALYAL